MLSAWYGNAKSNETTNGRISELLEKLNRKKTSSNYLPKSQQLKSQAEAPDAYFVDNYDVIKDLNNYLARIHQ